MTCGETRSGSTWIGEMFGAVDMMSPEKFISFLTEDAAFKFGNGPAVTGRANIEKAVGDFFASIRGLRHKILNTWEVGRINILRDRSDIHPT